ncbi:MAG: DUF748 domain-containing protein [Steroidobacter sp.]
MSTMQASISGLLKQHWIKLTVIAALIIIYALLGFLWLPGLIRDSAIHYVDSSLHRQLQLGKVSFNPFTFTLHVQDIRFSEASRQPIAGIHDLVVNAELSSLWRRAYVFKQVRIDSPSIHAIINNKGEFNLASIKPDTVSDTPRTAGSEWPRIHIGSFELLKGELDYKDLSRAKPFDAQLKPITFTLKNFRTEGGHENAFHFAALSDEHESLDWSGDFVVQPFSANGNFKVGSLKAGTIQSYLQDKLPFVLGSGTVNLAGGYKLTTQSQFDVLLSLASIHVSDARILPVNATDAQPWLTLPALQVDDAAISLHDRSVNIRRISLDNADVLAWLDQHHALNLLQLMNQDSTSSNNSSSNSSNNPSGAKWTVGIADFSINHGVIHAEDRSITPAAPFTVDPLQVHLQHISNAPGTQMDIDVQLGVGGASVTARGQTSMDSLHTGLQLQVSHFALGSLQNYLAQSTDIIIHGGTLNTTGNFVYKGNASSKEPVMQYAGTVEVNDLDTEDKATGGDFVKWQQVQLNNFRYALSPDQLSIDKIITRGLYGRMAINPDFTTNVQRALRLPSSTNGPQTDNKPVAATASAAPPMKIKIARVIVENGAADFSDASVEPNFAAGIQHLNGEITGLSTNDTSRATVKLQGRVDNYAPVDINGEVNFLAATAYSDLSLNFSNIELTTFNPYSGKFAGYDIDKGKLSTQLRYRIVDRKLDAQHHIVIDQLEFGKATDSKDAVSLPVKLAVALLKDRNGVIEIDLPVSGSLDDPEFHAGPLVWKALKNLLTKIVTAPFAALGSMFGGGPELSHIDFSPGSAALADAEKDKLDKLSHALVERPQLKLDIPLTTVGTADIKAFEQSALEQAVAKRLPNASSATAQQRLDVLVAMYQEKTGNVPVFENPDDKSAEAINKRINAMQEQLLPKFAVTDEQRNALALKRATAVQTQLLTNTGLDPQRVFMVSIERTSKSPAGVVRMELKLE